MITTKEHSGKRLDAVLALHPECEGMGLRGRRRLCEQGLVFVNKKPADMSYKVRPSQEIEINMPAVNTSQLDEKPFIIEESQDFIAIYKPFGLPSVALAGKNELSLEMLLPEIYPNRDLQLLNRLDTNTSGIVMASHTRKGEQLWLKAQEEGTSIKKYIAQVEGCVYAERTIAYELDISKSRKVHCLDTLNADRTRHTHIFPLECNEEKNTSLVGCVIYKGARHQIRCHLASIGNPLIGDTVYNTNTSTQDVFSLHHGSIKLPDFKAMVLPRGEAWKNISEETKTWLSDI